MAINSKNNERLKPVVTCLRLLIFSSLISGCVIAEKVAFVPDKRAAKAEKTLAASGIESVSIETTDAETLHALYLPSPESELLTLFFHGNSGNIHGHIPALEILQSIGSNVLGVSYRGYLNSTGVTTEEGIYEDARATLKFARDTLGFEEQNILIFGRSLGSAVAIDLAQGRDLFGLILVSPFTNSKDLFDKAGPIARRLVKDDNNFIETSFKNVDKAMNISAHTVVIHGTNDVLIPFELGERVFSALSGSRELIPLEGADHNDFGHKLSSDLDKEYWAAIKAVITR